MQEFAPQDAVFIRDVNLGLLEAMIVLGLIWVSTIGLMVVGIVFAPTMFYASIIGYGTVSSIRLLSSSEKRTDCRLPP